MAGLLHRYLAHPLTRGMNIDDPKTTALRSRIIRSKPFLEKLYKEWYGRIATRFAPGARVLELGSGAGFFRDVMPEVITSEVFAVPGVDVVLDARSIAMGDATLDGIVMTDVLHHIADCNSFFHEAARVVCPGGSVVMIEPWSTAWSRWVYSSLHHEAFDPDHQGWRLPNAGPLSAANSALPWIIFQRDRKLFEANHPFWRIESIEPIMPFAYLLSGGVSLRAMIPGWMYAPIRFFERCCPQTRWSMFAVISLRRTP